MIPSENIRYSIIAIIVTCHSPMKNRARWRTEIIHFQITRDDKLIDFNYIYGLLLKNTESDTRLWFNLRFWYFLINKTLYFSRPYFLLQYIRIYLYFFFNFQRIWEVERIRLQSLRKLVTRAAIWQFIGISDP